MTCKREGGGGCDEAVSGCIPRMCESAILPSEERPRYGAARGATSSSKLDGSGRGGHSSNTVAKVGRACSGSLSSNLVRRDGSTRLDNIEAARQDGNKPNLYESHGAPSSPETVQTAPPSVYL